MISDLSSLPHHAKQLFAGSFRWIWGKRRYLLKESAATSLTAFFLYCIIQRNLNSPRKLSSIHTKEGLLEWYLNKQRKFGSVKIYCVNVLIFPLLEEIFFRCILPKIIREIQRKIFELRSLCANVSSIRANPEEVTEEKETRMGLNIRVHLTALFFAFTHPDTSIFTFKKDFMKIGTRYLGGVINGYLKEKYGLLAPGFLAHGLYNFLSLQGSILSGRQLLPRRHWSDFRLFWSDLKKDQKNMYKRMIGSRIAFLLLATLPIESYIVGIFKRIFTLRT